MQHFEDERDTKRKKKEEKLSDQTLTETECKHFEDERDTPQSVAFRFR